MEFSYILLMSVLPSKVKGTYGIEEIIILIVYPDRQLMGDQGVSS
jgi:hypothetical protein